MLCAARRRRSDDHIEHLRGLDAGRRLDEAIFGSSPYVRAVERVLSTLPNLMPGETRQARDLAIRVVAQQLHGRCAFAPGTRVRSRSAPYDVQIVVGGKPAGFREEGGWNHRKDRPIPPTPWDTTLVWTARPDGTGIGQSRASDWIPCGDDASGEAESRIVHRPLPERDPR